MQIVSNGDNFHEMSNPVFGENIAEQTIHTNFQDFSLEKSETKIRMSSAANYAWCVKCWDLPGLQQVLWPSN